MLKILNNADYRNIEQAVHAGEERRGLRSGCRKDRAGVGLSQEQLDTLFEQWAGVDLPRFLQSLAGPHTRQKLQQFRDGPGPAGSLSAPCCQIIAAPAAPGKKPGAGLIIKYGIFASPFGACFLAMTATGELCHLSFVDDDEGPLHYAELRQAWPQATIMADEEIGSLLTPIFSAGKLGLLAPWRVLVAGTAFQLQVWQTLLAVPFGAVIHYQGLADLMGYPAACRAVARAVAANPVGYLIPCHRVIRKSGEIHHYHWGSIRKKIMLGWEACHL